jgi:hypothetical protein
MQSLEASFLLKPVNLLDKVKINVAALEEDNEYIFYWRSELSTGGWDGRA